MLLIAWFSSWTALWICHDVCTVTSRYQSWYDIKFCSDVKQQIVGPLFPPSSGRHSSTSGDAGRRITVVMTSSFVYPSIRRAWSCGDKLKDNYPNTATSGWTTCYTLTSDPLIYWTHLCSTWTHSHIYIHGFKCWSSQTYFSKTFLTDHLHRLTTRQYRSSYLGPKLLPIQYHYNHKPNISLNGPFTFGPIVGRFTEVILFLNKVDPCHFLCRHLELLWYGKDWFAQCQDNVTEWGARSWSDLHYKVLMNAYCPILVATLSRYYQDVRH